MKVGPEESMVAALIMSRAAATTAYEDSLHPSSRLTALSREAIWRCHQFVLK